MVPALGLVMVSRYTLSELRLKYVLPFSKVTASPAHKYMDCVRVGAGSIVRCKR